MELEECVCLLDAWSIFGSAIGRWFVNEINDGILMYMITSMSIVYSIDQVDGSVKIMY